MQNSFDTSFIPQQPLLRVEGTPRHHEQVSLALSLSFVLFFVSLITAGGIYFYGQQVDAHIEAKGEELASLEKSLDVDDITKYKNVEERIATGRALLTAHGVFSVILDFLEETTAKNIGLTALNYSTETGDNIKVSISGAGSSFQSVYFQQEKWASTTPFVKKIEMNTVNLDDKTGVVTFSAEIILNPSLLKYTKYLESEERISASTTVSGNEEIRNDQTLQ